MPLQLPTGVCAVLSKSGRRPIHCPVATEDSESETGLEVDGLSRVVRTPHVDEIGEGGRGQPVLGINGKRQ